MRKKIAMVKGKGHCKCKKSITVDGKTSDYPVLEECEKWYDVLRAQISLDMKPSHRTWKCPDVTWSILLVRSSELNCRMRL